MKTLFFFPILVLLAIPIFSQNVGIGESNPDEKLHVNGNVKFDNLIQNSNGLKLPDIRAYGKIGVEADTFFIDVPGSGNWTVKTIVDSIYCQDTDEYVDLSYGLIEIPGQFLNDENTMMNLNYTRFFGYDIKSMIVDGKIQFYSIISILGCPLVGREAFIFQIISW